MNFYLNGKRMFVFEKNGFFNIKKLIKVNLKCNSLNFIQN